MFEKHKKDMGKFMSGSDKKRRFGDRKDARRIRNDELDAVHSLFPFIAPKRTESEVYLKQQMDVTNLVDYVKKINEKDTDHKMTYFHAFVAAIAKTVYMRPLLNRYIMAKKYYERNDIILSFIAKRKFKDTAEEMLVSLKVDMKQDLTEISRYIYGDVKKIREAGTNSIDGTLKFLQKLPRFVNGIFVGLMRMLIYFDLYPSQFQKGDTNYSSVLISNLGSIKCDAPYHHLNNFGTNSVVICIGQIHKQEVITETGDKQIRDVVNFGITIDERIADGFYFAKSIRLLQFILSNPNLLERPIGEKIEYED